MSAILHDVSAVLHDVLVASRSVLAALHGCWLHKTLMGTPGGLEGPSGGDTIQEKKLWSSLSLQAVSCFNSLAIINNLKNFNYL